MIRIIAGSGNLIADYVIGIRKQLRDEPNRKTFRKSRHILLDIAIELEILRKVVTDQQLIIDRLANERNAQTEHQLGDRE